ncbi:segregation/condensation protein A [Patescibacteria group bacterium]|nr:segregation/condensation protein A [Patescibacteria group bacterium]
MYTLKLEKFQGPFNLLLQLIEKEKLDITEVSLSQVTDEFLNYLKKVEQVQPYELADFLEIAAKLILIKSRLLIPELVDEEEDGQDLINQLKIYQQYARVTKSVGKIANYPKYSFAREKIPLQIVPEFSLEIKIIPQILEKHFKELLGILLAQAKLAQKTFKYKVISLKQKINELIEILKKQSQINFVSLIKKRKKPEKIVMFLAVLELIKRRQALVSQTGLFKEIVITRK